MVKNLLRQIAQERDRLLKGALALPPERRAVLRAALAREFPVEVALQRVRAQRDRLLRAAPREVPRAVRRELQRSLTNTPLPTAKDWRRFAAPAALLAACLVAGFVLVFLEPAEPPALVRQAAAPAEQLSLRMNAAELAALRPNFLASNALDDSSDAPTRLRLDLPVRAFLRPEITASTP